MGHKGQRIVCSWLSFLFLFLTASCRPDGQAETDALNDRAYENRYRSIDSTAILAHQALQRSDHYADGKAEALNTLAFVSIAKMDYAGAEQLLDEAIRATDNQIEQLVAEVQLMRLCQRRSRNRGFYEHQQRATNALNRINEERDQLSQRQLYRLVYAESEMGIVSSTYYYYVGLERQSVDALLQVDEDATRHDRAQYLNYLYNVGSGGIITEGSAEEIVKEETGYLYQCLTLAERYDYPYFVANAREALAERLSDPQMAHESLDGFRRYGDVYQIAGAHRTLASCYHDAGNDSLALHHLYAALSDKRINQAPDLVASIREQLSVVYAALNNKQQSDYNRNIYIDLQERTRQDRQLEARALMLETTSTQLNLMLFAVITAILLLVFLLWLFNRLNRKQQQNSQLDEQLEEKKESVREAQLRVERNEQQLLEQRAKVSLVISITPLIDRILHEVKRLGRNAAEDHDRLEYVRELADQINDYNDVLTQWIQLRQGKLNIHVESFDLQSLFDIVSRSKTSFRMKQIELTVVPTDAVVKADRVLTLFTLNTLADNARKFTPKGGTVTLEAHEAEQYVEISVSDTGEGMDATTLSHLFENKPILQDDGSTSEQRSHGFGLLNCKGIIDKYHKVSTIFSVCSIAAESEKGQGSRFFFRLPKGIRRTAMLLIALFTLTGQADAQQTIQNVKSQAGSQFPVEQMDDRTQAHIYADSAYFSNISGTYTRTLEFADSCMKYLNRQYLRHHRNKSQQLKLYNEQSAVIPEVEWLHEGFDANYQVILDIRNESAVAALALHEWELYAYNNKAFTQLFKELSADNTLANYCRTIQQSQANKRIAVILLFLLFLLIVPVYYMQYYRHRLSKRFRKEQQQRDDLEMADDELRRAELENSKLHVANAVLDNCLSALKHETMYYPSRIRQLADQGDAGSLCEVANYYRELYGILGEQASRQVDSIHPHPAAVACYGATVRGDANLLRTLWSILVRKGCEVTTEAREGDYVLFTISQPHLHLTEAEAAALFTPSKEHIPYLLCRQVVRDHGEMTNLRGCGIWAEVTGQTTYIKLTLPRYGKL